MGVKQIKTLNIDNKDEVTVTISGKHTKVTKCFNRNTKCVIKKISKEEYIDLRTGEVKKFNKYKSRASSQISLSRTINKLRDIVNCNTENPKLCKWITLTYKENQQNPDKVYQHFKSFMRKLNNNKIKNSYEFNNVEYISIVEPQGRGAFHIHALLIFDVEVRYLPNTLINKLWKQGFTKCESLRNDVTNLGLYFSAHITDMSLYEARKNKIAIKKNNLEIVSKNVKLKNGRKISKKIVKGARYHLLPVGFNFYRTSRGIKRPTKFVDKYKNVKTNYLKDKTMYKNSTFKIEKNNYKNIIIQELYT